MWEGGADDFLTGRGARDPTFFLPTPPKKKNLYVWAGEPLKIPRDGMLGFTTSLFRAVVWLLKKLGIPSSPPEKINCKKN